MLSFFFFLFLTVKAVHATNITGERVGAPLHPTFPKLFLSWLFAFQKVNNYLSVLDFEIGPYYAAPVNLCDFLAIIASDCQTTVWIHRIS